MAAGMGSRYGGLKQMDPVTAAGEIIIDFSLYDAMMAGFKKVVFIIKKEMEADFRPLIEGRSGRHFETTCVFQDIRDIPAPHTVPDGRIKPWGTCHAVLSCRRLVDGPFAVVNADDFYGASAFQMMYERLEGLQDGDKYEFAMIGYPLENTLTEHGFVARGVCETDENGDLKKITERKKILRREGAIQYTEDGGETWGRVSDDALASMNFWGFTPAALREIEEGFPAFLDKLNEGDPLTAEYLLPSLVDDLLQAGRARVRVLRTRDRWYGVTYQEDRAFVKDALQALKDKGLYPEKLWP
jgi:hypothetical protein